MLIIFKELTNNFEQTLLDSLKKNDKEREFEILRKNLITPVSYTHLTLPTILLV